MKLSGHCLLLICLSAVISCNDAADKAPVADHQTDSLTEEQKHLPENALKELIIADGLEVHAVATEPMLKNPTNIDVDERGRIWVTEAYNYRPAINGNPVNPAGDRIVILEDNNGDGVADTAKIFYQGPELNAPLGVCVLGNKVLVSQSPYIWIFYDDNGDDKADRKEILFQGIGGEQHDHGAHSFSFGPDGKLYFNFGNEGRTLKDKNGKTVLDQDGDEIGPKKYKMGMVFRCNPDGSQVECLGQNFRNNYEAAVDSYGTIWQSDNDDDGNRGVRINYVMEHGNYGYTDEMTGASWQSSRTNMEDSIPLRHWHLNDPGVVPNLLQTGGGSPTGMVIYEGSLLPEQFRGQIIHCDAGPNVVRSYPVKKHGAGYTAEIVNILKSEKDQWFRPADVSVAPDGSLIVADWYDPGVGGHAAGDQQRGRIYRIAPPGAAYKIPVFDYTTPAGAVTALQNPNLAVRHHAWTALQSMGEKAVPELEKLWTSGSDPRMKARAFWALVKMPGKASLYIQQAIKDSNPDLRILGIRAAGETNTDLIAAIQLLKDDKDIQVLRECALALHHNKSPEAAELWAILASRNDDTDRWYLEALGIGADRQWDKFFAAFVNLVKDPLKTPAYRDIVWRARNEAAVPYLASLASEPSDLYTRLRYFRAFDFHTGPAKSKWLLGMINDTSQNIEFNRVVLHHLDTKTVAGSATAQKALKAVIQSIGGTQDYLELVRKYDVRSQNPELLKMAIEKNDESTGRDAAEVLLSFGGAPLAINIINGSDTAKAYDALHVLGGVGNKQSVDLLKQIAFSKKNPLSLRERAAGEIGRNGYGEDVVVKLLDDAQIRKDQKELLPALARGIMNAWRGTIRDKALPYLPDAQAKEAQKMPTIEELSALKADATEGKKIFKNNCSVCHQVGSEGFDFGPKLTEIGSKLPKDGLLEAILHPSAGISFGYEGWDIKLKDGSTLAGIISSKTETDIDLKLPGGSVSKLKTSDIASRKEMKESMMPKGLHEQMSSQDLSNLLEYLSTLKKK